MSKILPNDDHDTVVKKYAGLISKNNPELTVIIDESAPEADSAEPRPDIVVKPHAEDKILIAIEVETAATIDEGRARDRWPKFTESADKLQLVIPKGTVNRVRRMCKKIGVKAAIFEF